MIARGVPCFLRELTGVGVCGNLGRRRSNRTGTGDVGVGDARRVIRVIGGRSVQPSGGVVGRPSIEIGFQRIGGEGVLPHPRRQLDHVGGGMQRHPLQHVDEIAVRIHALQPAGDQQALNEAHLARPEFGPAEQPGFPFMQSFAYKEQSTVRSYGRLPPFFAWSCGAGGYPFSLCTARIARLRSDELVANTAGGSGLSRSRDVAGVAS